MPIIELLIIIIFIIAMSAGIHGLIRIENNLREMAKSLQKIEAQRKEIDELCKKNK